MSNLVVKEVNFQGDLLLAGQDFNSEKIYVGVSWICNGLGLSKSQKDTQVQKVQTDLLLKQGCLKFQAGIFDKHNETIALDIEFLPIWLAKINLTPKMQEETPELVEKLLEYQLKAKDVLANAFIKKLPQLAWEDAMIEMLMQSKEMRVRQEKLEHNQQEQSSKLIQLETEFNKEIVTEGYKTNDNIARQFGLYSIKDKPHFGFIDAIAKYLRIYNTTIGYKDEYVNVIRTTVHGGNVGAAVYYSDAAIDLIREFVANEFKPKVTYIVQGIRKGQIKEIAFQLNNKTYKFNESTYKKHSS